MERRRGRVLDKIGKQLQHLDGTDLDSNLAGDSSKDKVCLLHPLTLEDVLRKEEMGEERGEKRRRRGRGGRKKKHIGKKSSEQRKRRRRWRRKDIQQCHQVEEGRA